MKKYDVIIIGAGPAGIITGVTAKKQYPDKTILMIREEDKGLVPCGIPYIFHNLNSVEKNAMGPKPFIDLGGEVITDPVVDVDIKEKTLKVKSGADFTFDKLVFATGSRPVIASFIPGYDLKNVFYIKKSYDYINNLFNELQDKKNIVIVGGGFIGAEVAEQLAMHTDKKISLIESEDLCFSKAFSKELSEIATEELKKANVDVHTSTLVEKVLGENGVVSGVQLKGNKNIKADAVIFAVGYKPNTEIAKKAGLQINRVGAIIVDNYERSSEHDICAVGDCSQTLGFLTGRCDYIMLASTATAEARILGYNLFGIRIKNSFAGTIGIFSTEINGVAMAAAGLNEKNAQFANVEFISAKFSDVDRHPGAINDVSPLTAKLYVSPSDGSVLGGEVWGGKSAGEMINTIGLAIQKGITVYELMSLQVGTHPLLTTAPTKPVIIKAAEVAISKLRTLNK
ncbi:MAG: pyridine nucleotide-disulfide oxidoreductase [Bacteroidetes bacterium]|nr:MAG: pyridine nucleotide-disulfide oxidoreductase [Bacteroidota bacterium]